MKRTTPWRSAAALLCLTLGIQAAYAADSAVELLLAQYRNEGAGTFSAQRGAALWQRDFDGRSCHTCHGTSPQQPGRHQRTGKRIAPMAPSINPRRLTEVSHIRKWLLRNCKWTLGRACTAQEKGDVLTWLREQ